MTITCKILLPGGHFSEPKAKNLDRYIEWDDWRVLGLLERGKGGDDGARLKTRDHFRQIAHTSERLSSEEELKRLANWRKALGPLLAAEMRAEKSWYKLGPADIQVLAETPKPSIDALSDYSSVVGNIEPIRQVRLYARPENRDKAIEKIKTI
jgi:hypothetical protein